MTLSGIEAMSRWTVSDQLLTSLTANAGPDRGIVLSGVVEIGGNPTAIGGTSPYAYSWSPATGLDDATIANPLASPTTTTTYTVTVTDNNNDIAQDQVTVTIVNLADFKVTTANDVADGNTTSIADLVADPGPDGSISLREAISAANNTPGDNEIFFDSSIDGMPIVLDIGASGEDANSDGDLDITDADGLTITGNGESNTIIDGNDTERIFDHLAGDLTISDVTVQNGRTTIDHFSDGSGAGLRSIAAGQLTVTNSTFIDNDAFVEGGGVYIDAEDNSNATLNSCTFTNNTAGQDGGGVDDNAKFGTLEINGCIFIGNQSSQQGFGEGGGMKADGGTDRIYIIRNSTFRGNYTNRDGGGIEYDASSGSMTISNSTISGNFAEESGG